LEELEISFLDKLSVYKFDTNGKEEILGYAKIP
jgi:hypothetical protein